MKTPRRASAVVSLCLFLLIGAPGSQAQEHMGTIFPEPFVVEHAVTQTDPDGGVFTTEPVTDFYGGSWIVSVRPDDSRLVVDFSRREITEIRPATGAYSVISFDRLAELQRELIRHETGTAEAEDVAKTARAGGEEIALEVVELASSDETPAKTVARSFETDDLLDRPGVRRLRVMRKSADGDLEITLDAWFDPEVRLGRAGMRALEHFETDVLGAATPPSAMVGQRSMAAVRNAADGAFPFRTIRPTAAAGSIEDAASRIETLDAFPVEMVAVPDGLRRAPHPLELMVAHAKREAEINALMGGARDGGD